MLNEAKEGGGGRPSRQWRRKDAKTACLGSRQRRQGSGGCCDSGDSGDSGGRKSRLSVFTCFSLDVLPVQVQQRFKTLGAHLPASCRGR